MDPAPYEKRNGALEYVGQVYPELNKNVEGVTTQPPSYEIQSHDLSVFGRN